MTREEFDHIKPSIMSVLADSPPLPPKELRDKLIEDVGLHDSDARSAIWRLIDDGHIRLSLDLKLEVAIPQR